MAKKLEDLETMILSLPKDQQAELISHIIEKLDNGEDVEAENAWLDEAEHRYQLYREGKLDSKPAQQVFDEAFKKLQ